MMLSKRGQLAQRFSMERLSSPAIFATLTLRISMCSTFSLAVFSLAVFSLAVFSLAVFSLAVTLPAVLLREAFARLN
jgi:hypothetical protein